jgi:methoxymalonate biosynthesis acyl carrier protein
MTPIKETVNAFFNKHLKAKNIAADSDIFQSGLVNSLFAMQIVNFVEETFQIVVENDDLSLNNFRSLNNISEFVTAKLAQKEVMA